MNIPKYELAIIPIALLLAYLLQTQIGIGTTLSYLASLPIHECGHALIGNLSGILTIPTPFAAISFSQERSWMLITGLSLFFCVVAYFAFRAQMVAFSFLASSLLLLQIFFSFVAPRTFTDAFILYAGLGFELIGSAILILMFHLRFPALLRWHRNRYFILVLGCLTFTKAALLWLKASNDPKVLPFGALLDMGMMSSGRSDGDLDRLVRDFGWDTTKIISIYLKTLWLSVGMIVLGWATFLYKALHDSTAVKPNSDP